MTTFSDSSWKNCPENGIIIGAYTIFYQNGSIDHGTHVPGTVAQPSTESEYNVACTTKIALAHFRMLIHELLNMYPVIVPVETSIII